MQEFLEFIGNNLFWVSLWLALLLLLLWNMFGHILQGVVQIEPMDVTRLINHEHAVVIDIRNATDFAYGHILNSVNIPEVEVTDKKSTMEKMKKKPVIVYCQTGLASPRIVRLLKSEGFPAVFCLRGGIVAWKKAGMPLSRSTGHAQVALS